jgi:Amt family ammonium transporter
LVGGLVGNICTGIFAQASIAGSDGRTVIKGGWLDHHFMQLAYQLADSAAGGSYAFLTTVSHAFFSRKYGSLNNCF